MPMAADRAAVGGALAFHAGQQSGIKGVALGAIPALAGAHALFHFRRGFFHGDGIRLYADRPHATFFGCRKGVIPSSHDLWTLAFGGLASLRAGPQSRGPSRGWRTVASFGRPYRGSRDQNSRSLGALEKCLIPLGHDSGQEPLSSSSSAMLKAVEGNRPYRQPGSAAKWSLADAIHRPKWFGYRSGFIPDTICEESGVKPDLQLNDQVSAQRGGPQQDFPAEVAAAGKVAAGLGPILVDGA